MFILNKAHLIFVDFCQISVSPSPPRTHARNSTAHRDTPRRRLHSPKTDRQRKNPTHKRASHLSPSPEREEDSSENPERVVNAV